MRSPALYYADNLQFTREGTIWATWRLKPQWYKYAPIDQKRLVRLNHQALWQSLQGEVVLQSLCADIEPASIVSQMIDGVDLRKHELWLANAEQALASLEQISVGERTFWLSVPLTTGGMLYGITSELKRLVRLPSSTPSRALIESAKASAKRIEQLLPGAFDATPATPAQQLWMSMHAQLRGLRLEGSLPAVHGEQPQGWQSAARLEPLLDEGGQSDASPKERLTPYRRRYLKVVSPLSEEPSYQSLLALASTPKQGWEFPGMEWMSRLDEFEFDVDWCQRIRIVSSSAARRANKKSEDKLKDQVFQQAGNQASMLDGVVNLNQIANDLVDYQRHLNASEREVEIRATTILAVAGADPEEARLKRDAIREDGARHEFIWDPVLGGQKTMWWAMQTGTALPAIVEEYEQLTTGAQFATAIPVAGSQAGHARGALAGWNRSTGRITPWLFDPAEDLLANRSGSFACVGDLGSGKSVWLKISIFILLARGGRVLVADPTPRREYAPVAQALAPDAAVVDPLRPTLSLDPLRIFPLEQAARVVQTLFATMLGIATLGDRGALLAAVIDPEYLRRHGITSLGQLRTHLNESNEADVRSLGRGINLVASKDIGRVLFDDTLPALPMSSSAIVVSTADLQLPSQAELENPKSFELLTLEQVFGNAIYGLLAGMAEEICFSDHTQLAGFIVDELSRMRAPRAQQILERFITDGRKHGAILGAAGQTVDQLGSPHLRGLIPARFAFRQKDAQLAADAAEWVGLGASEGPVIQSLSPEGIDGRVVPGREGEAILRDARARVAKIKTQMPFVPELVKILSTTPELKESAA